MTTRLQKNTLALQAALTDGHEHVAAQVMELTMSIRQHRKQKGKEQIIHTWREFQCSVMDILRSELDSRDPDWDASQQMEHELNTYNQIAEHAQHLTEQLHKIHVELADLDTAQTADCYEELNWQIEHLPQDNAIVAAQAWDRIKSVQVRLKAPLGFLYPDD